MQRNIPLVTLDGKAANLTDFGSEVLLIVNVASECGMTPQYAGLEALYRKYSARGLTVLGFPCNQFGAQEPGSAEQIQSFCSSRYDVTFPMFEKLEVKGSGQHPLFAELSQTPDAAGKAGDVLWNFEKFLVDRHGRIQRFRSKVEPEANEMVEAIERALDEDA